MKQLHFLNRFLGILSGDLLLPCYCTYFLASQVVWPNLSDYGFLIKFQPKKKLAMQMEYHQFYADQIHGKWRAYKTGLDTDSDHYGSEIC